MSDENFEDLVQEVRRMGKIVEQLQLHSSKDHVGPMISMEEAAEYTGRSLRTFRREYNLGHWTSVVVGGTGHPKFSKADLDEDLAVWRKYSQYRRKTNVKASSKA